MSQLKISLGDGADFAVDHADEDADRLILTAYGHEVEVRVGSPEGVVLPSFWDETDYTNMARAWYHLLPYGEFALKPFPSVNEDVVVRAFPYHVRYEYEGQPREALVILQAWSDDPISWSAYVVISGVTIYGGELKTINWYLGETSLCEQSPGLRGWTLPHLRESDPE